MKLLASMLLAASVFASQQALAAWEAEPTHTHISFAVGHLGLTKTPGIFRKFDVKLDYDDKNLEAAKVAFSIDASSIDTNFGQRDEHLRGADWFNVQAYPKIVFVSQSVRHVANNQYLIAGLLTVRGKTLPVEFRTMLTNRATNPWTKVPVVGFSGTAKIKRSDFGMSSFLPAVADEVDLEIQLEIFQKP